MYPGAATLEAFDRNVVRDITFAGVAALFDCLDIVGEEPSILLDEVVHEEPIVADLERKDRHVGTMAEIPSGVNWAVDDLEIGNDASLAIGVAHQRPIIGPDDRRIRIAFKLRRIAILAHITPSGGKLCLGNEPSLTGGL